MMYDVVIIGAGIVGCACARECATAGLRVAIVERDIPAGATTAAGMGHIVVMDDSPAQFSLTHYSRKLWQELEPELPPAAEYEARGTLWIASGGDELAELHAKQSAYAMAGVRSSVLDSAQVAEAEPNLRSGLAGGLLVPEDAVLYPPCAAMFFLHQAEQHGAVLLRGVEIVSAGHGRVRLGNGSELDCGSIIAATGVDTTLLPWLPIQKRKGHLLITDRYPGSIHHQLVELGYLRSAHKLESDSVAFNLQPRRTGQLLIGSSRQYGNSDAAVDQAILREMLELACQYVPALGRVSAIRAWTGFRAATVDKLPLIGPTEDPTLFLAAGFEGLGITNAPGAARLLADLLMRRPLALPLEPYLPARAGLREPAHA
jgi:glycine/D-amino acid oxidase-like deaminating enzyme